MTFRPHHARTVPHCVKAFNMIIAPWSRRYLLRFRYGRDTNNSACFSIAWYQSSGYKHVYLFVFLGKGLTDALKCAIRDQGPERNRAFVPDGSNGTGVLCGYEVIAIVCHPRHD